MIIGDDPLTNGMSLSIRLRRDFTVTDAERLLATARRLYRELNPGTDESTAEQFVTGAADALYVILEHAGLLGDATDDRLDALAEDGLALGGWLAQVVLDEPEPLSPGPRSNCLRTGDLFALPPSALLDAE
ncbi:MAG TPA: hypothetical protein VL738_12540 [Dactylosporangium sp.]|jgi:hypothetical protein|nr:hypothetical protein [Dactylosporangium sp.]